MKLIAKLSQLLKNYKKEKNISNFFYLRNKCFDMKYYRTHKINYRKTEKTTTYLNDRITPHTDSRKNKTDNL